MSFDYAVVPPSPATASECASSNHRLALQRLSAYSFNLRPSVLKRNYCDPSDLTHNASWIANR
jgi:hypothetical protein